RNHFAAHLAVLEKWSKVRIDGGVQSVMRPRRQCGEGWGERSCCEGSGGLSDSALENQWQCCAPNTDLVKTRSLDRILEDLSIRPTEWCQQTVCQIAGNTLAQRRVEGRIEGIVLDHQLSPGLERTTHLSESG